MFFFARRNFRKYDVVGHISQDKTFCSYQSLHSLFYQQREKDARHQCCQGAEISAAKHKKSQKKFGGKVGAELFPDLSKKVRKGAELF
jgi:hypothetical protein